MGVRGLETFLERQCPNACYEVNIKEAIEKYKFEKRNNEILIVVDGSSCVRHLYGDLDWVFGGQFREFVLKVQKFVDSFTSLGARLVFYFDGVTVQRKRPVWIRRRLSNLGSVFELFDILKNGGELSYVDDKRLFLLPGGTHSMVQYIFKFICDCDVRTSVRECDEEIAAFAQANQCFAILGQDTDYVIYEGAEYYLSMKNLDLRTMTTLCYDRWAFAHFLRIPAIHLPLFASLCGNDIIQTDDLKDFHNRECRPPPRRPHHNNNRGYLPFYMVQKGVSNYIRRKRFGNNLSRHLSSIAVEVFRDGSKWVLLDSSLNSYSTTLDLKSKDEAAPPDSNWMKILAQAQMFLMSGKSNLMYKLLNDHPFEMSTTLEDFRMKDLPSAVVLLMPLRRRTYGILMQERTDWSGQVEEWCVVGTNTNEWQTYVTPIMPAEDLHPGLLALWDSSRVALHDQRWELFAKTISPKLNAADLQRLPLHLVYPTVILFYMHQEIPVVATSEAPEYLKDFEIKALAIQAVMIKSTDPSQLTVEQPYDVRAIRLAIIFMHCVTHINLLLAACGYPIPTEETLPWMYFDGKLFHLTYKTLRDGQQTIQELCVDKGQNSFFNEFELIRTIVLPE